ncbi:MAG: DUF2997 domain-containing protein [Bacteroidales bacterium]|nr:DUF2997 domain-containing protein [Bacteroidales bacterium]
MTKIIDVIIDENGEVKIETDGFTGKSCIEESQFIKDVMGVEKARHLKPVYFSTEKNKTKKKHLNICG